MKIFYISRRNEITQITMKINTELTHHNNTYLLSLPQGVLGSVHARECTNSSVA